MTTAAPAQEPRVNALKTFVPLGSLLALLTLTVGGAFFAADLRSSVEVAIEEIVEVKEGVRELRTALQSQGTLVTVLQQQQVHLTNQAESQSLTIERLRDRIHELELKVRD